MLNTHHENVHEDKNIKMKNCKKNLVYSIFEPRREKTNILVSNQVQHKPGCTATEDGWRLEISDLESRGIVLSM